MANLSGMIFQEDKTWDITSVPINYTQADFIAASPMFIACPLENLGIGVYPTSFKGILSSKKPFIARAHNRKILDLQWSPFKYSLLASCAMDGKVNLFDIKEDFFEGSEKITKPTTSLNCKKKVFCVQWSPTCEGIIGSASVDKLVRMWDVENEKDQISIKFKKNPLSFAFNTNGTIAYCFGADKKLRTLDLRDDSPVKNEVDCHGSVKGIKILYAHEKNLIVTTGFERNGDRSIRLYDPKKMDKHLELHVLEDQSTGILVPHVDSDLNVLYVAGRGESFISVFSLEKGKLEWMQKVKFKTPQLAISSTPKLGLNVLSNEIDRFYKLTPQKRITPVRVIIPKLSEDFQKDLFPNTFGKKPSGDNDMFFDGDDIEPLKKVSLNPIERDKQTIYCEQYHRQSMMIKKGSKGKK